MKKTERPRRKRLVRLLIEGAGTVIITGIRLWRVARSPRRRKAVRQLALNGVRKLKPWFEPLAPAWRVFDKYVFRHVRHCWGLVVAFHRRTPLPKLRRIYAAGLAVFLALVFLVAWLTRKPPYVERDPAVLLENLKGETADLIVRRRFNQAEKNIEKMKTLAPDDYAVLTYAGVVKSLRKDYDGARVEYRRAVEVSPGNFNAVYNLAELEFVSANYKAAANLFHSILDARPGEEVLIFRMYLCELMQGNERQAREYFAQLPPAGLTPAWYYANAARLFRDKKKSDARKMVAAARTLYPGKVAFFDSTFETLNFR